MQKSKYASVNQKKKKKKKDVFLSAGIDNAPQFFLSVFSGVTMTIWNFIRSIPIYCICPKLFEFDVFLNQYYQMFYSNTKNQMELSEINKNPEELTYGETPYCTMNKIFSVIKPKQGKVFYDLGCGRGKAVYFAALKYKLRSVGVDLVPTYVTVGQKYAEKKKYSNITFVKEDILTFPLNEADILYVPYTCISHENRERLVSRFSQLKINSYVITTTYSFKHVDFKLISTYKDSFSWGRGTIYIYKKIKGTTLK